MKKILAIIFAAAMLFSISGCGCKKHDTDTGTTKKNVSTSAPKSTPLTPATELPKADGDTYAESKTDGNIARLAPADEVPEVDKETDERDFAGTWRATATTSESDSFEALTIEIHYDSYNVYMTFGNAYPSVTYDGKYKIKNGVLKFDKNFEDCTAYFYDDTNDTLVLDNGTSLVFCTRVSEAEIQ